MAPKLVVGHSCVWSWWRRRARPRAASARGTATATHGQDAASPAPTRSIAPTAAMLDALRSRRTDSPGRAHVVPNGAAPSRDPRRKEQLRLCRGPPLGRGEEPRGAGRWWRRGLPWPVASRAMESPRGQPARRGTSSGWAGSSPPAIARGSPARRSSPCRRATSRSGSSSSRRASPAARWSSATSRACARCGATPRSSAADDGRVAGRAAAADRRPRPRDGLAAPARGRGPLAAERMRRRLSTPTEPWAACSGTACTRARANRRSSA